MLTALVGATLIAGLTSFAPARAKAQEADTTLFLPGSYEQYLPLVTPADAAISDDYIALADESKLYLYDRAQGEYRCYVHTAENGDERKISRLQFTPDGRLFYSDQDAHLFQYNFASEEASIQNNVPCATFVIDGDTLYTASVANGITTFYSMPHRDASLSFQRATVIGELSTSTTITPYMFVKDGVLYCAINSYVHAYTYAGGKYDHSVLLLAGSTSVQSLTSVAVFQDTIYFTVNGSAPTDGLYSTVLNEGCRLLITGSGFNALTTFGDHLYCVKGGTVRELARSEEGELSYTGYEIGASSDSKNRLSEGIDTVSARGLVVTADRGNGRVSVYDSAKEEFFLLESGVPTCVATDGNVIAVGVGNSVKVYDYAAYLKALAAGEEYTPFVHTTENIVLGLAVIYGRSYYVTEHHYGVAEEGAEKEFTRSNSPVALTSDVYGNLYVADQQLGIRKYTEEEFLDFLSEGTLITEDWHLPQNFRSLRADYDGNLYYLSGSNLFCNGAQFARFSSEGYVYFGRDASAGDPLSVALGFEDNTLYLQYGNYILKTTETAFPSLSAISAEGAAEEVFRSPEEKELSFVDVKAGVTGIGVDLSGLDEFSSVFGYTDYARTLAGGRGILLAQKDQFSLVALFERFYDGSGSHFEYGYTVALFRTEDCSKAPAERTSVPPATYYTTSSVLFSYYPVLSEALAIERLERSAEVTLLATLSQEEGTGFDFAFVRCGNRCGYLPLSYLTESAPVPPAADEYTLGYLKASEKGVTFRAADGKTLNVTERTQVKIYDTHDGLYRLSITREGVEYTAQVTREMLQTGNPNVLRMSVIIILCVLAVGILTAYILLIPRKKR